MNPHIKKNSMIFDRNVIILFLSFAVIMFPTSYNGTLSNFGKIVIYGYSYVLLFIFGKMDRVRLTLATFLLLLILFFTALSDGMTFAGNQFITTIALLIILSLNINTIIISKKIMDRFSLFFLYILIICGYLLANGNTFLINLFIKFYTFAYEELARNMYSMGKPIMFFITHSVAALSLTLIFIMMHLWGKASHNVHIVWLSYLLIPLVMMQQSFSSYFMLMVIFFYLVSSAGGRGRLLIFVLMAAVTAYYLPVILDFDIGYLLGNSNNGIESRYGSAGVYSMVIDDIRNSLFIGKGLLLHEHQYKADSGVLNELLRGGVVYFIIMKVLIFLTFLSVSKKKKIALYFTLLMVLNDFAYSFTYSLRGPVLILILLIYLNNIRIIDSRKEDKVDFHVDPSLNIHRYKLLQ